MLVESADRNTLTATLLVVAQRGDTHATTTLLDRGADANAKDAKGNTVLMLTASSDAIPVEAVRALVGRGVDLNAQNLEGRTALDLAKQRGSTPVVDLLVNAGAKAGASDAEPTLTRRPARSIRAALERSIPLLQSSASTFTRMASCVSCHSNSLTAMTVATARRNGFSVDERMARDQKDKIGSYLATLRERYLQGVGPGEDVVAAYDLLGLAAENYSPDSTTDAMARFLGSRQLSDGRWQLLAQRPPIEANDDIPLTSISLRALQVYGPKAQRATYEAAVKRATAWLMRAQPRTTQERAFQLLGLGWAGVDARDEIVKKAVRDLIREQRPDGGWAQLPSLASDAYATGQALVALRQAGAVSMSDPSCKRGIEFLLKTQLEDGSWYVKSRAIPIQPYFESGFPHGRHQFISAAATNWAATALALNLRRTRVSR